MGRRTHVRPEIDLSRRQVLAGIAGLVVPASLIRVRQEEAAGALAALETRAGGRLGVCILEPGTGRALGHRLDERFAMCSTFKLPLAGIVLREADRGQLALDDPIRYTSEDMVPHAPVTSVHLRRGRMTVGALAEAMQVTSDNVAANLLLRRLGGPEAFTRQLRALGDEVTRLDRLEPELNLVLPGDDRDTTSPRAMAATVARVVSGGELAAASRERLIRWMVATTTGRRRLRAGLPPGWRAGDKTGTARTAAMTDKVNDVAAVWPPRRPVLIAAAYFDSSRRSSSLRAEDEAVLADVGRLLATWATR